MENRAPGRIGALVSEFFDILPMRSQDVGEVMAIELKVFPDPWTPLAYLTELEHNPLAHYFVARSKDDGAVLGYIGYWERQGYCSITNIAVSPKARRLGVGRALVSAAIEGAKSCDGAAITLDVREANAEARAFYAALGFQEADFWPNYYNHPVDNGIAMVLTLDDGNKGN